jgi:hypothetical protein
MKRVWSEPETAEVLTTLDINTSSFDPISGIALPQKVSFLDPEDQAASAETLVSPVSEEAQLRSMSKTFTGLLESSRYEVVRWINLFGHHGVLTGLNCATQSADGLTCTRPGCVIDPIAIKEGRPRPGYCDGLIRQDYPYGSHFWDRTGYATLFQTSELVLPYAHPILGEKRDLKEKLASSYLSHALRRIGGKPTAVQFFSELGRPRYAGGHIGSKASTGMS